MTREWVWVAFAVLLIIIGLQWFMLTLLLFHKTNSNRNGGSAVAGNFKSFSLLSPSTVSSPNNSPPSLSSSSSSSSSSSLSSIDRALDQTVSSPSKDRIWKGVSVTLAFSAPKWFHRRYVVMIQNVLMNTPDDWAVQIIANGRWWQKEILLHHRNGMGRLLQNPRVIWTQLPESFVKNRYKPKQVMTTRWFWQALVADRVLIFSGNGALCSNANTKVTDFDTAIDFMGAPTTKTRRPSDYRGGDSSTHSLRNRPAMLAVLTDLHATNNNNNNNNNNNQADSSDSKPLDFSESEGEFFVSHMLKLNQAAASGPNRFRLATYDESVLFAGTEPLLVNETKLRDDYETIGPPMVISGTQAQLPWEAREAILNLCPEIKVIFPSMHDPNCFGAHPQPDQCAASICALKNPLPASGC